MQKVTSTNKITLVKLAEMSQKMFGNFVKAVIDIEQNIMVVDADLHADEEAFLLDEGSPQENLWGFNIYPTTDNTYTLEFDSMINIRPMQNNQSRTITDPELKSKITDLVAKLIQV